MRHKDMRPSDTHGVIAWYVGNQTERGQLALTTDDIGKFCFQTDTKGIFFLRGVSPTDWQDMTLAMIGNHYHIEFEPIDATILRAAQKGVANGLATLGADSKIPSNQLPSYVDDVLEFANKTAFPATGETGKIYIDLATNYQYRWSGSVYTEIVHMPGSTDAVAEGTTNKYFTDARAIAAIPVASDSVSGTVKVDGTSVTINNGVISAVQQAAPTSTAAITTWIGAPWDIYASTFGLSLADEVVIRFIAARAFTIPSNFTGSISKSAIAAAAQTIYVIKKNGAQVATLTFATASTTGVFSTQGAISFSIGDSFSIVGPAIADVALADIDVSIVSILA